MRGLTDLDFDNTYARLDPAFYQVVDPTPLTDPRLVAFNPDAARLIDLDPAAASDPDAAIYLSGGRRLPGAEPIAAIYAGHQFGVWVPQLGDGRAILLGEAKNGRGERWDLQLKGAGMTRFSRMGDGRAVLRSTIREYLASIALEGLGIPTTRALAIVASDDPVYRETPETAATLIRMAPTHVRFGTFQLFASRGQHQRVAELADYVIGWFDPDLAGRPDRYERWLERTANRTADLIAHWTAAGFAHGVMNTDNMSILGLTLDYGPYGFLDEYDPGFVCNHSDHDGRYAFDRQPAVGLWNLARLAEALLQFLTEDAANEALGRYPARFAATYAGLMRARLGLRTEEAEDATLIGELLEMMAAARADYHRTLRTLAEDPDPLRSLVLDLDRKRAWLDRYRERVNREGRPDAERRSAMVAASPKYVLRNYLAQEAIDRAGTRDYSGIDTLVRLLREPFAEHAGFERYAEPSPPSAKDLIVSCSS